MRRLTSTMADGRGYGVEVALLVVGLALALVACAVSMSLGAPRLLTDVIPGEHIETTADAAAACTIGAAMLVLAAILIGAFGRSRA